MSNFFSAERTSEGTPAPPSAHAARQTVLFALALLAAAAVVVLSVRILLVIFAGVLFALVLHAAGSFLERHLRVPYKAAVGACVVLLLAATVLGIYFSLPSLSAQARELAATLPQSIDKLRQTFHLPPLKSVAGGKSGDYGAQIAKWSSQMLLALSGSVEALGSLVVFFFVGVYGALEPESYARIILWCVPGDKKRRVRRMLDASTHNLQRWLLGRLVAMLFVAVASGVAFMLLGVPLALPLAVFAGLLTFVEYVGAFASALPPVLLAFSRSPTLALWVVLLFTGLHIVEGYVLTPLLARTAVRFPPASTLASQAIFSALLGPLGLTFATPLLVVGVTSLQEWRKNA